MKIKKLHIYLFKDNIEIVQKNGEIDEYIKNLRTVSQQKKIESRLPNEAILGVTFGVGAREKSQ